LNFLRGPYPMATDNQVILAAQLTAYMVESSPHVPSYAGFAEINGRFVPKWTLVSERTRTYWNFKSCHKQPRR